MEHYRRNEISTLIQRILAGKHKCGLAGDSAIKDLWDENVDLRADRDAALSRAEEAERELCGARKALIRCKMWFVPGEASLGIIAEIDAALSSSSPLPARSPR